MTTKDKIIMHMELAPYYAMGVATLAFVAFAMFMLASAVWDLGIIWLRVGLIVFAASLVVSGTAQFIPTDEPRPPTRCGGVG